PNRTAGWCAPSACTGKTGRHACAPSAGFTRPAEGCFAASVGREDLLEHRHQTAVAELAQVVAIPVEWAQSVRSRAAAVRAEVGQGIEQLRTAALRHFILHGPDE